jgi:ABC-2 type transport system ATP-binding protein
VIAAALHAVTKRFGEATALDGVSLEVRGGEVLALLGPNGAGKTTAVSLLLGLRRPDAGRVELFGRDPRRPVARTAVGVTPQETGFPPTLRVRELVDLVSAHFRESAPSAELLDRFGLGGLAGRQTGGLSGGERQRLSVALAFAGRPRLLLLDEPTAGLDVEMRRAVWLEVRAYADGGGTVLMTTHHVEEAETLASRVVLLAGGRVVADGTSAQLAVRARADGLEEAFLSLIGAG